MARYYGPGFTASPESRMKPGHMAIAAQRHGRRVPDFPTACDDVQTAAAMAPIVQVRHAPPNRTRKQEHESIMHTRPDIAGSEVNGEFHSFIADIEDLITSMTPLTGEDL